MKRYVLTAVTLVWWSIVLFTSGPSASSGWTKELLRRLFGLEGETLAVTDIVVRKTGHCTYYAILTLLLALTLTRWIAKQKAWLYVGALLAVLTGCFDEIRQSFYPNRTGTAFDLIYDVAGAGIVLFVLLRSGQYSNKDLH